MEPTGLLACVKIENQIYVIGTMKETGLKTNAGLRAEIVMAAALVVFVGHLGGVNGTALVVVGEVQEMKEMTEASGRGAETTGGMESRTETGIMTGTENGTVTERDQDVAMMMIVGGQGMVKNEAEMEGGDGEEEISLEKKEVGVVVMIGGEGIEMVTENDAMIKTMIEEGEIGIGIKTETEIGIGTVTVVMVGVVEEIETGTRREREVGEIVMERGDPETEIVVVVTGVGVMIRNVPREMGGAVMSPLVPLENMTTMDLKLLAVAATEHSITRVYYELGS